MAPARPKSAPPECEEPGDVRRHPRLRSQLRSRFGPAEATVCALRTLGALILRFGATVIGGPFVVANAIKFLIDRVRATLNP